MKAWFTIDSTQGHSQLKLKGVFNHCFNSKVTEPSLHVHFSVHFFAADSRVLKKHKNAVVNVFRD